MPDFGLLETLGVLGAGAGEAGAGAGLLGGLGEALGFGGAEALGIGAPLGILPEAAARRVPGV